MKLRWWVLILLFAAGATLLGAYWQSVMIHLSQETGTSNSASRAYDYWSGFGSVIPWSLGSLSFLGAIFVAGRHRNCHVKGCWRFGKPVDGTPYLMCHKHHPDHKGTARSLPRDELLAHIRELRLR